MLKIGLVGAWHVHFDGYAKEAQNHEGCVITRLWESDEAAGRAAAEKYGCEYFSDYGAFLAGDEVDAVIVSSATNLHPELMIKAARAKKHIFTEKVLAITDGDALKIKEAVDESGVKFCISFPWRSRPDFLWVKQALEDKLIGEVTYCRMRNAHSGASNDWLPASFYDPVACGGGAMMDLGAHGMYLLNWLLGEPKRVTSVFTNFMVESVEDNAVCVLEYESGAIGVNETAFVADKDPFSLEITGTKGTIFAGGPTGELVFNIGMGWIEPDETPDFAGGTIDIFLNGIINGGPIPYGIDDAVALTRTMSAAYRSAAKKAAEIL